MKWLTNFFKKLWNAIRKILSILLIVIAVILLVWATLATGGATLALFGFVLTTTQALIVGGLALAGAFLIDKGTASKTVGKIGEAVSGAAGAVGSVVGGAAGGAATGVIGALLGNPYLMAIGIGVAGYFLLKSGKDSKSQKSAAAGSQVKAKGSADSGPKPSVVTPISRPGQVKETATAKPARRSGTNNLEGVLRG